MSYFKDADNVNVAKVVREYADMNKDLTRENIILRIQLQQHIDRENELLEVLKTTVPEIYNTLKKGDEKHGNTESKTARANA